MQAGNFQLEEKPLYNVVGIYRQRGNYLQRLDLFEKSIVSYTEALRWNENDVHSLLGRSLARAKATHYMGALADANLATELEPSNLKALQMRAKNEYEKGSFERALVLAHRGQAIRKLPPDFADCARVAEQTIRECNGKMARKVLSSAIYLQNEIRRESIQDPDAPVVPKRKSRMATQHTHEQLNQVHEMSIRGKQKADAISRLMASKYLERMAHDKHFLTALCKDERLASANKQGSILLQELANQALCDVERRQSVLRERCPLYAARGSFSLVARTRLSRKRKEQMKRAQEQHIADAKRLIGAAQAWLEKRDTTKCIENAEFGMEQISKKQSSLMPGKDGYLQELYEIVADAFLDQKTVRSPISEADLERRAFVLLGICLSREPSRDSILRVRPPPPRDAKVRISKLERMLSMSGRPCERCYYMHELGRLYLDCRQPPKARFYASKCQSEARVSNQRAWLLNATFLLGRCHVQNNNRPEARSVLLDGVAMAKNFRMTEVARFFETCVDVSLEGDIHGEDASLGKREKAMVGLMQDSDLKSAAEQLFRKMSVLPAQRRFSVLPGSRVDDSGASANSRRMSIIPKAAQPTRIKPKLRHPLGFQEFDI